MKNRILTLVSFLFLALPALAQTNNPPSPTPTPPASAGLLLAMLPVIVPLLVSFGKWMVPKLPSWLLPILAPALGAAIDWIGAKVSGGTASPVLALALGSAGVGLREIVDQIKQAINPPSPGKIGLILLPFLLLGSTGCRNPNANVGPALLRLGVSTSAGYSILKHPEAVPGVRAGASVVCAAAHGTNVSPAAIVAALDAYGEKTPETVFILNAAVSAYEIVYAGLSDTNSASASPYAIAVCDGLNDALLLAPSSVRRNAILRANVPRWPQVKFK